MRKHLRLNVIKHLKFDAKIHLTLYTGLQLIDSKIKQINLN